jgi:predicted AlkP superfamily phosphohydrolase/phosphomutase
MAPHNRGKQLSEISTIWKLVEQARRSEGRSAMQRVFIVGWDGATFDLIRPWVAEGKLPHVARLMRAGVHGPLRSTIPPWTVPAWTSFMTGKNPGQHGIFDVFQPRAGTYALEVTNGSHRRAATFWQLLSEAGRKVISISLPCTFPPEPVSGGMISGFGFPEEMPGYFVPACGMYPRDLYAELQRTVGPHPVEASISADVDRGRLDLALERILETIHQKAQTAKYLMSHRPWDCFMILFGEADSAGRRFWKYCDPGSPLFTDRQPELRDSLLRVYEQLDHETGALLDRLPEDTTVLVVSGHGLGGVSDWALYPNCWLQQRDYLRLRNRTGRCRSSGSEGLKPCSVTALPAWLQRCIYRFGARLVGRLEARMRYGTIDWEGTQAYFDENSSYPVVRVNLRGRQPKGIVEPGWAYEELRNRLIRDLETWRHPQTGARIVERAFRREEIYSGPCLELAPDVIPKWALHNGYSYAFRYSSQAPDAGWIEQVDPRRPEKPPCFAAKSGTHRDHGMFLARGPRIRADVPLEGARLIDLAPTILTLLDVPVPVDMDGRVLRALFTDFITSTLPIMNHLDSSGAPAAERSVASSEDEARILVRLHAADIAN